MALILEDGSAPDGANSYVSEDMADSYFDDRGNTTWTSSTGDKESALVRASAAIDATYRDRFPGYRTHGRDQGLEWPRGDAYDNSDLLISNDEIPREIIQATCEAALRELASPGSMLPDLARDGAIEQIRAGSVEIRYGKGATGTTTYLLIDGILSGLLQTGSGGGLFGEALRS